MKSRALKIAEDILQMEREFFQLSKRHTGIIHAHSELWCAENFGLDLPQSGVSSGADGIASSDLFFPLQKGDRIQIKGRGDLTMHVTFKPYAVDWLMIVTYDITVSPVRICAYLYKVSDLTACAQIFKEQAGKPVIPLKFTPKGDLRLEWNVMKSKRFGKVVRSKDTWDARHQRFSILWAKGYQYIDGKFKLNSDKTSILNNFS